MPPDGHTEESTLPTPYQGLGARGVNNLAAKLLLTLFPPNTPFFRLAIDDFTLQELTQQEGLRAEVEESLNKVERATATEIETTAMRVKAFLALKYLVVVGDALLYLPDEGGMKVFRLDQYVVRRDPMGNPIEIVVKEEVYPSVLPDDIRDEIQAKASEDHKETVEIYTHVLLTDDRKWESYQECMGKEIPESRGLYPYDESPWLPERWTAIDGEDYGRSHVDEYLGDLMTLEALSKAITEGSVEAARILYFVRPNGSTNPEDVAKALNGDVKAGTAEDVSVLQLEKYADFRVALERVMKIEERLSRAFLLMESIRRDAERVTAEEIREMAKELEDSLGGVYSVLSQELQLPLVRRLMAQMSKSGRLPKLPDEVVKPTIVTGLEALGRGHDLTKLQAFTAVIQNLPPSLSQKIADRIDESDLVTRISTALGIDADGLVLSEEEYQQRQQQMALQAAAMQAGPGVAQELTKGAVQSAQGESQGA